MIVGVLTTCHTQYTSDSSICVFPFNRTTLQVFVTYLTGALYVHRLWFYKHQHDNRVRFKLSVAMSAVMVSMEVLIRTDAPCILKLCVTPSNGIVRWWLFPEFGAELPLENCTQTVVLNNLVQYINLTTQTRYVLRDITKLPLDHSQCRPAVSIT